MNTDIALGEPSASPCSRGRAEFVQNGEEDERESDDAPLGKRVASVLATWKRAVPTPQS